MMKGRRRWGLTLMELLIVVAIITALAALLFPVFQSVRENAYMTTCRSNLRQIYHALQLYKEDYGEFFYKQPERDRLLSFSKTFSKLRPVECDLAGVLEAYSKNKDIFLCPASLLPKGFCLYFPESPPMSYIYYYPFARWKNFPITDNLVSHFCTWHGKWRMEHIKEDVILAYTTPELICLMDGSIHLYHIPALKYWAIHFLYRPFDYP